MSRPTNAIRQLPFVACSSMQPLHESVTISDEQLSLEQRSDGAVLVRVRSAGTGKDRLPDAVFAFRCGDPQYAYWLARLTGQAHRGGRQRQSS